MVRQLLLATQLYISKSQLLIQRIVFIISLLSIWNMSYSQDTTPPIFTKIARDTTFECGVVTDILSKLQVWYDNHGGAIATDGSGIPTIGASVTIEQAINIFNSSSDTLCGNSRQVSISFIAIDAAGNQSIPTTAVFKSNDNIGPDIINEVPNVNANCIPGIRDSLIMWIKNKAGYQATDLCSNSVTWTNFIYQLSSDNVPIGTGMTGNINIGPYPLIPNGLCNWSINISFMVMDECGNASGTSGTTTFTVIDNVAPTFVNPPQNISVSCDDGFIMPIITVNDGCTQTIVPTLVETTTKSADLGMCGHYTYSITRVWTATDSCGNSSIHQQIISVADTTKPIFTGLDTISLSCGTLVTKPDSIYIYNVIDNCLANPRITFTNDETFQTCGRTVDRVYIISDACNNSVSFTQHIKGINDVDPIIYQAAKNLKFNCNTTEPLAGLLTNWVNTQGDALASSPCGIVHSFSALKGTYTLTDPTTFPGIAPTNLPRQQCPSPLKGYLRYVEVDFVFYDDCGNASVSPAVFGVADDEAPLIIGCQGDTTIFTSAEICQARLRFNVPGALDECTESESPIVRTITAPLTSDNPGSLESIVDPLTLNIGPFNPTIAAPLSPGLLKIKMNNVDIDDVTEFFVIYDEAGNILSQTPSGIAQGQCTNYEFELFVTQAQINTWIQDGIISLRFEPNIVPGIPTASINNFCNNSSLQVNIEYEINISNTIRKFYSIDNGIRILVDTTNIVDTTLVVGLHTIDIIYMDCAQNERRCLFNAAIKDTISPSLICPPAIEVNVDATDCSQEITIPLDIKVDENCGSLQVYSQRSPKTSDGSLVPFIFFPSIGAAIAQNKQIVFTEVSPIKYTNQDARIKIEFYGDNNDNSEFFEIKGPGGFVLGQTPIRNGMEDCGLVSVDFTVPKNIFNSWIVNGQVVIFAIPNDQIGLAGIGINSCVPINENQSVDGISKLNAILTIYDAALSYSVSGSTQIVEREISIDSTNLNLILNGGQNVLTFYTLDNGGNKGSCTTNINIIDNIKPAAKCKNNVVTIHPSGLIDVVVNDELIDNGSTDNCAVDTSYTDIESVSCAQVGQDVAIKLYVKDKFGNLDSCSAIVKVKATILNPSYESGLCSTDTIRMFANLPSSPVEGSYTYEWVGPGTIKFFTENPIIAGVDASYNGPYVLTVTGFGNCISMGTMNVNVQPLTNPLLTINEATVCEGSQAVLSMTSFVGNIRYTWYEGINPTGVVIGQTSVADLVINPTIGTHFYYSTAEGANCKSKASNLIKLTVLKTPLAAVNDILLTPCEGDDIKLGSSVTNPNFEYFWNGPSYTSQVQNPTVTNNASIANSGKYFLVIRNGICASDTATTEVQVFLKPKKPRISTSEVYCAGATVTMVALDAPNSDKYEWYKDATLFTTTTDNNLVLNNAQLSLQGSWTVKAFKGTCSSDFSIAKFIAVDVLLEFGASNSGPTCAGDSLQLVATFVPNATYTWDGPGENDNIPSIYDPKILAVEGDYSVTITTPTLCQNNASTFVKVISVPQITALSSNAAECMNPDQKIGFFPSFFPNDPTFTYKWNGPNNFVSTSKNPERSNISLADTGRYSLIVLNQGCPSDSFFVNVNFGLIPPLPILTGQEILCEGDTLKLQISNPIPNATYIWTTPNNGDLVTSLPFLIIAEPSLIHQGNYQVQIVYSNCKSLKSISKNIVIRSRPSVPMINSNSPICYGDTLILTTTTPQTDHQFSWYQNGSIISNSKTLTFLLTTQTNGGTYTLIVSKSGCKSDISLPTLVTVKNKITTPTFVTPNLNICTSDKNGVQLCLNENSAVPNGVFQLTDANNKILKQGTSLCQFIENINQLIVGTNFVFAHTIFDGCRSESSSPVIITLNNPPNFNASIVEGNELSICPDDLVKLTSQHGPPLVSITWSIINAGPIILNPNEVVTGIDNLSDGNNLFALSYSAAGCKNFSNDTINLYQEFEPTLNQDVYTINYGTKGVFDITANDSVPLNSKIKILAQPKHGSASIINGNLAYDPDPRYIESQLITYEVCPNICPQLCSQTTVIIDFNKDVVCQLPNLLTPNGDGINDTYLIPCLGLENYPKSHLTVFNEWGQSVYNSKPYENDWDGTYGGEPLPAGTYFVVLDLGEGSQAINGFTIIQR
jgi:gliding motility-associated-like protein